VQSHQIITKHAPALLPTGWREFFQYYDWLLNETAAYPDTYYREMDPNEGYRHYIDLEIWSPVNPWTGTLPQAVEEFASRMRDAIAAGEWNDMFLYAGRLAHYVADAAQPYHATVYYNPVNRNGTGLHEVLDASMATYFSELKIVSPPDVGPFQPIDNITSFVFETAKESHSFLVTINRTLIDEGLEWSSELMKIIENRTNTAIVSVARVWYTAIVRSGVVAPQVPEVNQLRIIVENMTFSTSDLSSIRLHVIDSLGVKTYADVRLTIGAVNYRGFVANVVPPLGEYVIILGPGSFTDDLLLTADKTGYHSATLRLGLTNKMPSSMYLMVPFTTLVAIVMILGTLVVLVWYRRFTR